MTDKMISIVIPCCNAQDYIEQSLQSVVGQSYKNYEVIVMDCLSTDNTINLLKKNINPKTKIISERDHGVADALNKGFALSKGDILCWLNADDVYLSTMTLATVVDNLTTYGVDFVHGHSVAIDEDGVIRKTQYSWTVNYEEYLAGVNMFTGSVFFNRSAWDEFGGFDIKYKIAFEYQFFDFLFRYKQKKLIDFFLAALRHHPNTLTQKHQSLLKHELEEIRHKQQTPLKMLNLRRVARHATDGNLIRVIKNMYFDRYAGKNWLDLYHNSNLSK